MRVVLPGEIISWLGVGWRVAFAMVACVYVFAMTLYNLLTFFQLFERPLGWSQGLVRASSHVSMEPIKSDDDEGCFLLGMEAPRYLGSWG